MARAHAEGAGRGAPWRWGEGLSPPERDGGGADLAEEGARRLRQGHIPEAVRSFSQGLEANPDDVECLLGLARAQLAQGERADARDVLQRLLALRPGHPEARSHLAALEADGGGDGAVAELRALALERGDGYFEQLNLAHALLDRGDFQGAEAAFTAALRAEPRSAVARLELGRLLLRRGEAARAEELLGKVAEGSPEDPLPGVLRVRALRAMGELGTALRFAEELAQRLPSLAVVHEELLELRRALGHTREALQKAAGLRALDPESARYAELYDSALRAHGDAEG
ncbi:MAG TPA: tetratricopeptide repeat protein [Longimicrobium sp.]|nr:tetratricopeptide repeat protein [Longimicrobium sp.]